MDFGYKTFLALTLATAACWRAKAQVDSENLNARIITQTTPKERNDSDYAVPFNEAFDRSVAVSNYQQTEKEIAKPEQHTANLSSAQKDSILQEQIFQSILDIEYDLIRYMSLSEDIKFVSYWDRAGRKQTIGPGLTTRGGRRVRRGDRLRSEIQMLKEFRLKAKQDIVPTIAKYIPHWTELENREKIVLFDMFWNNGAGAGVLTNKASKNTFYNSLSESQKQEIADSIKNNNKKIVLGGTTWSMTDLPEWRNLSVRERAALNPLYSNKCIVKADEQNPTYSQNFRILSHEKRQEIAKLVSTQQGQPAFAIPEYSSAWQSKDSTIHYQDFVIEADYTPSDVNVWYRQTEEKQLEIAQKLAEKNKTTTYNGHLVSAREIPAWYFLSQQERNKLQSEVFKGRDLFRQNSKTKKQQPILSGLCCELNLYLADKTPENKERVAARIASFVHAGDKVLSGLLKRANLRAQIFLGNITFGKGKNQIDLDEVHLGATSEIKIADLNNPQAICDSLHNCKAGLNYQDTILRQESLVNKGRIIKQARTRSGTRGR